VLTQYFSNLIFLNIHRIIVVYYSVHSNVIMSVNQNLPRKI